MSAKPWEQTWRTSENEGRTVETCDGWRVAEAYPASEYGGVAERFDVARLIAAAPDMARALLAVLGPGHTAGCWNAGRDECIESCAMAREALRKAGVLP